MLNLKVNLSVVLLFFLGEFDNIVIIQEIWHNKCEIRRWGTRDFKLQLNLIKWNTLSKASKIC